MKERVIVVFIIAFMFVLSGCTKQVNLALSEPELSKFIFDHEISPLAIRHIGDSFTVILYETNFEMGNFSVSSDQNGTLSTHKFSSSNNSSVTPVSISYTSSGIPYATVIINDPKIQSNAKKIKAVWDNGHEIVEETQSEKGFIISDETFSKTESNLRELIITDQEGKILFEMG